MAIQVAAVLTNPATVAGAVGVVFIVALFKYLSNGKETITKPKLGPPPEFKTTDPDIVVVGGGISGAAFAARLGMSGKKVVMIEREMGFVDTIRGEVLLPGGINALEKMGMKDVLDDVDGCHVKGAAFIDIRMEDEPGYVHYPEPGGISMHHGYLVNALRKKAIAQKSVTVIEAVGKSLIKEKDRVVGVIYKKKGDEELHEVRAPLTVVGDGYYSKLSTEYRTTHKPVSSETCIGLLLKNYEFKSGKNGFLEVAIGSPYSISVNYKISENETRSVLFMRGKAPSNLKQFYEQKVVPKLPEHMKKPVIESLAIGDQFRVVKCQKMPANLVVTPGILVLGDALNTRNPVTASGMTVALCDVNYWWHVLTEKIKSLTDDAAILQEKGIFRKERQVYSFAINTFAEINIRLLTSHDQHSVTLLQQLIKVIRELNKPNAPKEARDALFSLYGGMEADPAFYRAVLDNFIDGTVQEIFKTRPYLTALWESMQVRKRWKAVTSDIMQVEAMT